jgi:hypothetical protein
MAILTLYLLLKLYFCRLRSGFTFLKNSTVIGNLLSNPIKLLEFFGKNAVLVGFLFLEFGDDLGLTVGDLGLTGVFF